MFEHILIILKLVILYPWLQCIVPEVGSEFLPLQLKSRKSVHIQRVIFLLWWHHKVLSAWAGTGTTIIAWHKAWGWTQRDLSTPSPSLSLYSKTPETKHSASKSCIMKLQRSYNGLGSAHWFIPSISYKCDTFSLLLSGVVWSKRTKFTRA